MRPPALRATFGLVGLCLLATAAGCHGRAKPPPVSLDGNEATGPLVFPPRDQGWQDRTPLKAPAPRDEIRLNHPDLDENGHFEVSGQTVTLSFDEEVFAETAKTSAPQLSVTPSVRGRSVWVSPRTVEFRADVPFDAATAYTATLPALVGPQGKKLSHGFRATFHAKPEVTIAGKIIHYLPKAGEPRVIYVRPTEDRPIGPAQQIVVLYDQPIDLPTAGTFINLKDANDHTIPLRLTHPPAGQSFEGEKVDTRCVVLAKMTNLPAPGAKVQLLAKSADAAIAPTTRTFEIPQPPKLESFGCGDARACKVSGATVVGPVTEGLTLHFSNAMSHVGLDKRVRIAPKPPNLRIGGWDDDVTIDATFAPQTKYEVIASGLVDAYGFTTPEVRFTFSTEPRTASAILREGVLLLDENAAKNMFVTTRNVKKGELLVWDVPRGADALARAMKNARTNDVPTDLGEPRLIPFEGVGAPHAYGKAAVNVWGALAPGGAYLAQVRVREASNDASIPKADLSSPSSKPSVPLLLIAGENAVGAHVHTVGAHALVTVYRLGSGEPVPGASVSMGKVNAITDERGVARLDSPVGPSTNGAARRERDAVVVRVDSSETLVPLDKISRTAGDFYPEFAGGQDADQSADEMGVLITDRGIYRPGSKIFVKGLVRKADAARIVAVAQAKVRVRVIDPSGNDMFNEARATNAQGAVTADVSLPKEQRSGVARLRLEVDDTNHTLLAEESVRIADFEAPRFKVDIESPELVSNHWKSKIVGKYLFGAPMDGGRVDWTIKTKSRAVSAKKFEDLGFTFVKEWSPFEQARATNEERPRTGEGKLGADGMFNVDVDVGTGESGPSDVTFEADVSDASYRHVAARKTLSRFPFARYAGVRVAQRFGALGPLKVELVAVDKDGGPLAGVPVEARLERLEWKKSAEKAESGAIVETWGSVPVVEGSCRVSTAGAPAGCTLVTAKAGEYRVVARVDGRDDASATYYAWGNDGEVGTVPSAGKKVALTPDKKTYRPSETAKVLVQSPFAEAMAVLTVERGGLLSHEAKRFKGSSTSFDIPLDVAHAPYAYAVVSLLPISGGPDATYRIGAVRLPVELEGTRLSISVASDKKTYDVRETTEITIDVKRGNVPVKNADVTLAVVDEGVLRLTNFHAKDPTSALHPARPLAFGIADSRQLLFRRHEKAHVAGGGGSDDDAHDARHEFVETAAWLPNLVTDAQGRVTAKVKLPDNLTEFRMMATVLGEDGAAGAAESSFVVRRPYVLDAIVPAFARKGDTFQIGAMAHNNTDAKVNAKVVILGQSQDIALEPKSHVRVTVPYVADKTTKIRFSMDIDGKPKDTVEKTVRVEWPGTEEHPQLSGVFRARQEIELAIPEDATFDEDARLTVRSGSALYPELGQRLAYLLDYPHGCVEQTTSGLLPLLAARNLLPWTGTATLDDAELHKRIAAGVKRLATMKTERGGLAYWPFGREPDVYGTTYAALALLEAQRIGIEEEGLLHSVLGYLETQLPAESNPTLKVAIAAVLGSADKLPADAGDALYDARDKLDAYGLASLALALASHHDEGERTKTVLDLLEASFDTEGVLAKNPHGEQDYAFWGSSDRDRAQALIALTKLRPSSKLCPVLAHRLLRGVDRYTTQSTAWSLMALSAFIGKETPKGSADVKIRAEGFSFDTTSTHAGGGKMAFVRLERIRGKKLKIVLEGDAKIPAAFALEARYVRPDATSTRHGRHSPLGPSVYRVFTDASGGPVALNAIKPGDIVRVAMRVDLPKIDAWRAGFLAVTDRLPAGFSPIQPDLATVARVSDVSREHPFYEGLTSWGGSASHVDIRDDRVNVYFDRVYGGRTAYATYLVRATTEGEFILPSARGELMYEPGSEGYSESARVTIR